jgi:ribosomal protein S7
LNNITKVINLLRPLLKVKQIKKSGKVILIPAISDYRDQLKQSVRWVVLSINGRKDYQIENKVISELNEILITGKSKAFFEKEKLYRSAIKNRALYIKQK